LKHIFTLLFFFTCSLIGLGQKIDRSQQCDCSKIGLNSHWADTNKVSCYLIQVPKDASKPEGEKFSIAVAFADALTKTKEPPLLYLHGGPGIATIENIPRYLQSQTWKVIRKKRSLLFFDYRGTGFSEPALCPGIEDSLTKLSATNLPGKEKQINRVSLYSKYREQLFAKGIDISTFSAMQLAADAEYIRSSLKIPFLSIYGVSFGTTVALNILRSYDRKIKSVILDSPFPPNAPWVDFVHPFDICFKTLEKNIASDSGVFSIFPSIRNDFVKAVKKLNEKPAVIKHEKKPGGYNYTGDDFAWSIWDAMLKPKAIPFVPLAIHEVANGNDSILPKWVSAFSNADAFGKYCGLQNKAILCFEARPRSEEESTTSLLANYPDFSSFVSAIDENICDAWRPDIADKSIFTPVTSNVPVLILSGEYDPVCPPLFGDITASTLVNAISINVPSASHAAIHADDCIRNIAITFLLNPSKKPDIKCVYKRQKMDFVTEKLLQALTKFKK